MVPAIRFPGCLSEGLKSKKIDAGSVVPRDEYVFKILVALLNPDNKLI
jgi:hypothetical protein